MVERLISTQNVAGSSPVYRTKFNQINSMNIYSIIDAIPNLLYFTSVGFLVILYFAFTIKALIIALGLIIDF